MTNAIAHAPRSRAPRGSLASGRIPLSLMPAEREQLERLATEQGRTLSAMARMLILRGLSSQGES